MDAGGGSRAPSIVNGALRIAGARVTAMSLIDDLEGHPALENVPEHLVCASRDRAVVVVESAHERQATAAFAARRVDRGRAARPT